MMGYLRLARLILHALGAVCYGTLVYPFITQEKQHDYVKRWSQKLMNISRVRVRIINQENLSPRSLIVANHVSWLDIYVIYSVIFGHFIAKASMAKWPLIGWMCRKTGTLFIERTSGRNLKNTLNTLVENLKSRERCIFFPEGTTGQQGSLLPFHPNLFEGAILAGLPIQPCAIRYVNPQGQLEPAVDSHGNISLAASMINVFNTPGITAEITILPVINTQNTDRKTLSTDARNTIASALKMDLETHHK